MAASGEMTDFEEKSGTIEFNAGKYAWAQTIDEVVVTIPVPIATRGRDLEVVIKSNHLKVKLKSQPEAVIDGELSKTIKTKESIWTLEDKDKESKEVKILLGKAVSHESWKSLIKGQDELDPFLSDQMDKKMMLERFQKDYPGFDFSGAQFNGQLPSDPKNWLKDLKD